MHPQIKEVNYTGLSITHYKSDNIYPLLPLLSQEFPNWTIDKIKNYIKINQKFTLINSYDFMY